MKYGYARISLEHQDIDVQVNALKAAGCKTVFKDRGLLGCVISGSSLDSFMDILERGDVLVVYKLDCLGCDTLHVFQTIADLEARGVTFQSLSQDIDTSTVKGRLFVRICAIMAENERNILRERTIAGIEAAKTRGVTIGRPMKLSRSQVLKAKNMIENGTPIAQVARTLGVGRSTLYRYMDREMLAL